MLLSGYLHATSLSVKYAKQVKGVMKFRENDFEIVEHAAVVEMHCSHCGEESVHVLLSQPYGIGVGLPFMKPKWSSHRLYVLACSVCSHFDGRVSKDIAEELVRRGKEEAAEQEHMEDELERWRKATIDNPTSSEAFFHFGRMLYELDRWEDSVPIFEKSVELNPENCEALAMLGLAHGNLRAFSKSVLALERAYQLDSSHPGRVCAYGESLVLSGDTERADQIYSELLILDEQYAGKLRSFIEADRSNA